MRTKTIIFWWILINLFLFYSLIEEVKNFVYNDSPIYFLIAFGVVLVLNFIIFIDIIRLNKEQNEKNKPSTT